MGGLDKILKAVLRGMHNSMKSIDDEVLGEMKEGKAWGGGGRKRRRAWEVLTRSSVPV